MKKIIIFALVCAFSLALVACGGVSSGNTSIASTVESSGNTLAWRKFLKAYETWADSYVEIVERYKEEPTASNLLDYSDKAIEMGEWLEKIQEISKSFSGSSEEFNEYLAERERILKKITDVME